MVLMAKTFSCCKNIPVLPMISPLAGEATRGKEHQITGPETGIPFAETQIFTPLRTPSALEMPTVSLLHHSVTKIGSFLLVMVEGEDHRAWARHPLYLGTDLVMAGDKCLHIHRRCHTLRQVTEGRTHVNHTSYRRGTQHRHLLHLCGRS